MRIQHLTAALAVTASLALAAPIWAQTTGAETPPQGAPKQVLFVGNSYFYYNDSLHNHTRRMAGEGSGVDLDDLEFRSITISGGSLDMHPIDHYLTPGAIGYDAPFDLVVLQGNSAAADSEVRSTRFRDAVKAMDAKIKATGARTALYMTHAYAEGHPDYDPDGTAKLDALYTSVGKEIGAMAVVMKGQVDQIILTGGIAYGKETVDAITDMVGWIAPITVYPGEDELLALAQGALRVLNGEEPARVY